VEGKHTGVPASALQVTVQDPQWSTVSSVTHFPSQSVYPGSHESVQVLLTQAGWPCRSFVAHAVHEGPHAIAVLVVSTQAPLQLVGASGGQLAVQA
jgi:hypothetical protein